MGDEQTQRIWLRIIHINDVYELDNFPSFYSLVQDKSGQGADRVLVVLPGDFLAPSLLSSLDKGNGMVDILNRVGITHVCLGNHECDIPSMSLKKRITEQSQFTWINSNLRELDEKLGIQTPEYDVVTVRNTAENSKRIGMLGLLSNDPALYRPGSFENATIEPVIPTAKTLIQELMENQNVDFILPLTHQSMKDDRQMAKTFGGGVIPIIIGGHEHNPFDETVDGARIVKTGCDAMYTNIIDIIWDTPYQESPSIAVEQIPTTSYPPNPEIRAKVQGHWNLIKELEKAKLFQINHWATEGEEFSTQNNRLQPSFGTTALITMLRMGLQAQCCILNAGSIRGDKDYPKDSFFTWSDLKNEIRFETALVSLWVPGYVLEATIQHSRKPSKQDPPVASGAFLHTCNNIQYNHETEQIESICGAPMNPRQLYLTGMDVGFLRGIDNHEPLLEWAAANAPQWDGDVGSPAKLVVVELFSALLWLHLGSFEDLDSDADGLLNRDEVKQSVSKHFDDPDIADLVVDNVFAIADINGSGSVSPMEMIIVHLVATDLLSPRSIARDDGRMEAAIKDTVAHVLNIHDPESERVIHMVQRIRDHLHVGDDGVLRRAAHERALGKLRRRSLLL